MRRSFQERAAKDPNAEPSANLVNRPTVRPHLSWIYDAFWSLCADRGGDGSGSILFTAISEYARRIRIHDADEFMRFEALIRAMDSTWVKHSAKKARETAYHAEMLAKD